jgi:hypothetical protein
MMSPLIDKFKNHKKIVHEGSQSKPGYYFDKNQCFELRQFFSSKFIVNKYDVMLLKFRCGSSKLCVRCFLLARIKGGMSAPCTFS